LSEAAAQQYFAWHGLEQPRVPLMLPEFSNPLFLNVYCQALAEGSVSARRQGTYHVSEVFETYLAAKEQADLQQAQAGSARADPVGVQSVPWQRP
jgi:hypothetical protein